MIGLLIISIILGAVVSGITGIGFLFWVVSIALFVCGLPFALITGFIHGEVDYAQDRADYRQAMADIAADEREFDRQLMEDERIDRILAEKDLFDRNGDYIDNRQVHLHNHYNYDRPRDSKGRFLPKK